MKLYKQIPKKIVNELGRKIPNPAYKTAKWWATFEIHGRRFRVATGTNNRSEAQTIADSKRDEAKAGTLSLKRESFARLNFSDAADRYFEGRKGETSSKTREPLAASSLKKERQLLMKPKEYFKLTPLNQITAEHVRAYQDWRAKTCGPAIIGMELGCLRRILRRARLWQALSDSVVVPKPPDTIGRALTPDERTVLLEAAAERPEWQTAYFAAILALNTTMRGAEIKGLQWQDVDLLNDTLTIRKGKTAASARIIPLTPDAFEVFVQLRKRAELFGAVEPSHYVFASFKPVVVFEDQKPVGSRITSFDPTRPIGSWKKAWGKLTAKAGLSRLRFHDLRHSAITQLLSNPRVSIQTIKAIAGHLSQRMIDRYAHIHLETKRSAILDGLSTNGKVINQDIKRGSEEPHTSQVIDSIGRRVGI